MNTSANPEVIERTANTILVVVFLFVAMFLSLNRIDKAIKNEAIHECAVISRFEQSDEKNKTKVSYPVTDIYKQCLKDKGISK